MLGGLDSCQRVWLVSDVKCRLSHLHSVDMHWFRPTLPQEMITERAISTRHLAIENICLVYSWLWKLISFRFRSTNSLKTTRAFVGWDNLNALHEVAGSDMTECMFNYFDKDKYFKRYGLSVGSDTTAYLPAPGIFSSRNTDRGHPRGAFKSQIMPLHVACTRPLYLEVRNIRYAWVWPTSLICETLENRILDRREGRRKSLSTRYKKKPEV